MGRPPPPVEPNTSQSVYLEGRSQHGGDAPAGPSQSRRRTRRGARHVIAATINANLSWARVEEFMEEEIGQLIKSGGVP
eukprot:2884891-Pyramimonas_sp.AAC.1